MLEGQQARLTQAALETLAVVAYKQPVSRARVSAIRGVNVDGVMRTLLTRGLVEEAGTGRVVRGHAVPHVRATSSSGSGSQSIEDLPELAPYLPDLADMDDLEEASARGASRRPRRARAPSPTAAPNPRDASPRTTTGWSACRSCWRRPASPRAASARS